MELPRQLSASGLAPKDYDLHFEVGNVNTQYWDFFPVPADKREFLFEVHSPAQNGLYFRVILKDDDLTVINSTPQFPSACVHFERNFSGTIGADFFVRLQIKRDNAALSGTEQYAKIGKILFLSGAVDSLGYFTIEEKYPKNTATGILQGRFDASFQTMSGYFSKPDGSRLQPFDFHALQQFPNDMELPPQPNCEPEQSSAQSPQS